MQYYFNFLYHQKVILRSRQRLRLNFLYPLKNGLEAKFQTAIHNVTTYLLFLVMETGQFFWLLSQSSSKSSTLRPSSTAFSDCLSATLLVRFMVLFWSLTPDLAIVALSLEDQEVHHILCIKSIYGTFETEHNNELFCFTYSTSWCRVLHLFMHILVNMKMASRAAHSCLSIKLLLHLFLPPRGL